MGKNYMKLGVLLIAILTLFGGIEGVNAVGSNDCNENSETVIDPNSGNKYCQFYSNKYDFTLTVKDCDQGQGNRYSPFKFSKGPTYLSAELASLDSYAQYKDLVKEYGCPVRVRVNWDDVGIDDHNAGFVFRYMKDYGGHKKGETLFYEGKVKGEKDRGYSIRDMFYNKIKNKADGANEEIVENIQNMRDALKDEFNVSNSDGHFFDDDATPKNYTYEYSKNSGKYTYAYFNVMNPTELIQTSDQIKRDAKLIRNLSQAVKKSSEYSVPIGEALTKILNECYKNPVLEGFVQADKNVIQTTFIISDNYNDGVGNVDKIIRNYINKAPNDKKNMIRDTTKSCNRFGVDGFNGKNGRYGRYINSLKKVDTENQALITAINNLKQAADEKKIAVDLDESLNIANNAQNDLTEVTDLLDRSLSGLKSENFDFGKGTKMNCESLIGTDMMKYLNTLYFLMEVAAVVLTVIMSMTDFAKATFNSDADSMKKAWKKLSSRIIMVMILVLLPLLVSFIINLFGIKGIDPDHPICIQDDTTSDDTTDINEGA